MNIFQRVARRPWAYRWLVLAQRPLIERLEPILRWISRGRFGVLDLAGLHSVQITAPGRRTGIPRTSTVQYVPDRDSLLLVGSNWGRPAHPSWSTNLAAAQEVTVRICGTDYVADVRLLIGAQRDAAWSTVLRHWPNYAIAQRMAGGRQFRLFLVTPIHMEVR